MFNAAYAALIGANATILVTDYRTHKGLIAAFGKHVILGAQMNPELGRAINRVRNFRQAADYLGDPPLLDDAEWAVGQAEAFVEAIKSKFETTRPPNPD